MFKFAKSRLAFTHNIAPSVTAAPLRGITTHSMIINEGAIRTSARKDILDMYGEIEGNLGILRMNREHRFNQLTPNMIENISRGVETMNIDHIITTIYLGTENHKHFSGGTDFRTIAFMKKEDNYGRIKEYLQQVYQLQTQIAKLNKPLIAVAPGHCYNSGAALLAATAHPMTTLHAKIAFNEVTFGFVPHSGATYYLSRMPGEFGTFMGLTGLPINGSDAAQIELINGVIEDPKYYAENVSDYVQSMEYPSIAAIDSNRSDLEPWDRYLYQRSAMKDQLRKQDLDRFQRKNLDSSVREEFLEAHERIPSSTAEAEYKYMQLLREESSKREVEPGYFEFG
jgi:enoyl-CoA hydratase/carnithine racemase